MIDTFIRERKYLNAVTDKTLMWYKDSFKAFANAVETEADIKARIVELRERGVKPVSINTWLRCIRAYWEWQGKEWKLPTLKEEQKIIATLTREQLEKLIRFKPSGIYETRTHVIALTIADTGLRASEVLGLTKEDADLDNLIIKVVMGKGKKQRLIPFSIELRKHLFRQLRRNTSHLIFGTENNTAVSVRNFERDLKEIGIQLGFKLAPHMLRHTFAVMYLRSGGNLEFLRRILGHSSISTSQKYLRSLGVEDLSAVHSGLSPLCARPR